MNFDFNTNEQEKSEYLRKLRSGEIQGARQGEYWSEEEDASFLLALESGVDIGALALRYERNEMSIYQRALQLGGISRVRRKAAPKENRQCRCPSCPLKQECTKNGHC